jgi:hypothetical protein
MGTTALRIQSLNLQVINLQFTNLVLIKLQVSKIHSSNVRDFTLSSDRERLAIVSWIYVSFGKLMFDIIFLKVSYFHD